MYCKTDLDEEYLGYAYRAGFVGTDKEAFIEGNLLVQENGIWQPARVRRVHEFHAFVAKGRTMIESDRRMMDRHGSIEEYAD